MADPGARRAALFFAALACACAFRPLASGIAPGHVALYVAFLALWIAWPGWLFVTRCLRRREEDWFGVFALAVTHGYALLATCALVCQACGAPGAILFLPLAAAPLLLAAPREPPSRAPGPSVGVLAILLALVLLVTLRALHFPDWWQGNVNDLLFHVGNAAEVGHNWPWRDPRFAGLPLNYHAFAYALPVGAGALSGATMAELVLCTGAATWPVLLAIVVFHAGRAYGGSASGALVAVALLVFHADLGVAFRGTALERWLSFENALDVGIWTSPTTCAGLVLFAALATRLKSWFAALGAPGWRDALALGLLGFAASGTKGSVMPVVLGGLGACALAVLVVQRKLERRALAAFLALAVAALPVTAWLATGEGAYANAMFRWSPGAVVRNSGAFAALRDALGGVSGAPAIWLSIAVLPVWLAGYLGLAGWGAAAWFAERRARADTATIWLAMSALTGLALAVLLLASGSSQLFFFYNGQVGLALLAGAAFARPSRRALLLFVPAALALTQLAGAWPYFRRSVEHALQPREEPSGPTRAYRAGLDWLREHAPSDALVLAKHAGILISAHAERRAFHETGSYTPAGVEFRWRRTDGAWDLGPWREDGFDERRVALDRFFAEPSRANLAELEPQAGTHGPLYVLVDRVRFRFDGRRGHWYDVSPLAAEDAQRFESAFGAPAFANEAVSIHEVR